MRAGREDDPETFEPGASRVRRMVRMIGVGLSGAMFEEPDVARMWEADEILSGSDEDRRPDVASR
jgi:hypothetical protein